VKEEGEKALEGAWVPLKTKPTKALSLERESNCWEKGDS
jgi:hypothetical protein